MPLNVLIVPDKFKGTLTATQAAEAIAQGWRSARPEDRLDLLPMSDGGDGFGEIISRLLDAEPQLSKTVDAAHRPIDAAWWLNVNTELAIVESARVIGLAMLPPRQFDPVDLDTDGVGTLLRATAAHGATRCLLGIGGSATNDGGFGMARAVGWRFLDRHSASITRWIDLDALSSVRPPEDPVSFHDLTVAVDVRNPLLGPEGCSRVFGPQKGLIDIERAERALGQLATIMTAHFGEDMAVEPGAGAAGGLGFGLRCFAGARLEPGIDVFTRYANLEARVRTSQLVITGEGAIDAQTTMGKGVGEIARLCLESKVPCIGMAGAITEDARAQQDFHAMYAMTPDLTDRQSAMLEPALWLERLAARVATEFSQTASSS